MFPHVKYRDWLATLLFMAFKLRTKSHAFTTFFALIRFVIVIGAVDAHVGVRVPFILIFVITKITVVPTSLGMALHMSV